MEVVINFSASRNFAAQPAATFPLSPSSDLSALTYTCRPKNRISNNSRHTLKMASSSSSSSSLFSEADDPLEPVHYYYNNKPYQAFYALMRLRPYPGFSFREDDPDDLVRKAKQRDTRGLDALIILIRILSSMGWKIDTDYLLNDETNTDAESLLEQTVQSSLGIHR